MEDVTKIWVTPLPADSPYVRPFRFHYIQNGVAKNWDLLKVHDSVAIIIFNKTRQKLVLVKQFRPAVYYSIVTSNGGDIENLDLEKFPPKLGLTLEFCAGIIDKNKSFPEIAKEEVIEECGYNVPIERLEEIIRYRSGVGSSGSMQILYYCEVTDDDRINSGGGVEGEIIDVIEVDIETARSFICKGSTVCGPPSFLFGILWFLTNKAGKS